jgi:hypothetical protein
MKSSLSQEQRHYSGRSCRIIRSGVRLTSAEYWSNRQKQGRAGQRKRNRENLNGTVEGTSRYHTQEEEACECRPIHAATMNWS